MTRSAVKLLFQSNALGALLVMPHPYRWAMKTPVIFVVFALTLSIAPTAAAEKPALGAVPRGLAMLKAECDVSGQSNESMWGSYISATESKRHEIIAGFKLIDGDVRPELRRVRDQASGEYRQMLEIALAAVGDATALPRARDLMLHSELPPVRVCAARELRGLKDKNSLEYFKQALADGYNRKDRDCVPHGNVVYPVRVIAADALVELGVSLVEVRRLRGEVRSHGAQPAAGANHEERGHVTVP